MKFWYSTGMDTLTWMTICVTLIQTRIQMSGADACDNGWLQHEGYCYYIANEAVTWYEARDKCLEKDAALTSIWESGTKEFIIRNKDPNTEYWIGLKLIPSNDSRCCQWLDGSNSTWNIWGYNEPNGSGNCTRMSFKGKWRDTACNKNTIKYTSAGSHNISYICKKVPPSTTVRSVTGQRTTTKTTTTTTTKVENATESSAGDNIVINNMTTAGSFHVENNHIIIPLSYGVVGTTFIILIIIIIVIVWLKRRRNTRQKERRENSIEDIVHSTPTTVSSLRASSSNEQGHESEQESVPSNVISSGTHDVHTYVNYAEVSPYAITQASDDVLDASPRILNYM